MTIAATLVAMGMPLYSYVTNTSRVSGEINALLTDIQYARVEAIKEGSDVTICGSKDGQTCGTAAWQNGWIVFSDVNGNGVVDANEPIRRVQIAFGGTDTLAAGGLALITFNRNGFALALPATTTFSLHTTPVAAQWTRCVQVTQTGKAVTQLSGVGGCL